jgi:hypothetical protein
VDRAEDKCSPMWRIVLSSEVDSVKEHFFGEVIKADEQIVEDIFKNTVYEILDNVNYDGDY